MTIEVVLFIVGFLGSFVFQIVSILYHKKRRSDSFEIARLDGLIRIRPKRSIAFLNAASLASLSLLAPFIIKSFYGGVPVLMSLIISILLLAAVGSYQYRSVSKEITTLDPASRKVSTKSGSYAHFMEPSLEIKSAPASAQNDDYGLYLVDKIQDPVLIYGYSTREDLESLRRKLLSLLSAG